MPTAQIPLEETVLRRGAYAVRFARSGDDVQRCQQLRHKCFVEDAGGQDRNGGVETDKFDSLCDHIMTPQLLAKLLQSLPPILHIIYPKSMLSCSEGSRGLSVPLRVIGIFTDTTISPRT